MRHVYNSWAHMKNYAPPTSGQCRYEKRISIHRTESPVSHLWHSLKTLPDENYQLSTAESPSQSYVLATPLRKHEPHYQRFLGQPCSASISPALLSLTYSSAPAHLNRSVRQFKTLCLEIARSSSKETFLLFGPSKARPALCVG
jgi:hypothetical protein